MSFMDETGSNSELSLRAFVQSEDADLAELPTFHLMKALDFRHLVENSGKYLHTSHCKLFDEDLLYLFYGRPSYRIADELEDKHRAAGPDSPIAIVVKPGVIDSNIVTRIYPFDTGGAKLGKYAACGIEQGDELSKYELPPALEYSNKVVKKIFGSNKTYFQHEPIAQIEVDPWAFELHRYVQLIGSKRDVESFDDRCSAIEIQLVEALELNSNTVDSVIFPKIFQDSKLLDDVLDAWEAEPLPYSDRPGALSENQGLIFAEAWKRIEEMKWT